MIDKLVLALALLAVGFALGSIALWVVWRSKDTNKYRKLIAVTVFLTFDLIVFGGFTRLTDSGLGCPDWPGCYSEMNPLLAHEEIKAAEAALPHGPVTVAKAWIEMIHRYLAMAVGMLIVAQVIVAWRMWYQNRHAQFAASKQPKRSPWMASFLLFFVCLQGAFGAWTVTLKLQPIIVTTHLLLGLGLLSLLVWSLEREQTSLIKLTHRASVLRILAPVAFVLLWMQIGFGGWVSTNYAALACTGYPTCNGVLLPDLDWEHAFHLWRKLGQTAEGEYLPYSALVTIQWVHRSFAWVAIFAVGSLAMILRSEPHLKILGNQVLAVLLLQFLTGVGTVYFNWPLALAVLHNAGAAMLVLMLTMINYRVRYSSSAQAA
ncbi:COX15/CtaA family protein [Undibacterium cyanobacteriorum]|uniref:COX15/CtaA family protein n=1 Tax=Undibacterium cyanobacteriorum TaxID=3073561 RepID=A0ABY9RGM6_9BURK|nr:COX15/CtaA family protein [Undibacterium sp. 20NA77.5]WMW80357.1 COX15/CtaA family protein [Undibacterium sp. 20NA77.5]